MRNICNDNNDFSTNLNLEKEALASEENYLEAAKVRTKLKEIKDKLSGHKKNNLNDQHQEELQMLEENYVKEIFSFNQEWDAKLNNFNDSAKEMEQDINQRHEEDMDLFIQKEEEKLPKNIKFSSDYLSAKRMEMQLVKVEK